VVAVEVSCFMFREAKVDRAMVDGNCGPVGQD
jgi:hypothetical protein